MAVKRQEPVQPEWGLYSCSNCGRLLELEKVVSAEVERRDGNATGYIAFEHHCRCMPGAVVNSRRWGSYPSFLALFGSVPILPYEAPFAWNAEAEADPVLSRWSWELSQLADVGEFMLFADDAAQRRVA